ncbi:hypothetical protein COW36_04885 [bacterium (Candidatus Blackallbacteria) CG17_big_fil_post_rev_8_21_14_2_50_48_46]|uniref:mannan endo-1,4-beta-mannosidase n=1 Tax=bacterium (Candidatus Blackallbacteria) CG17_big_fil_post_rev_8_21_14_2_50_48_46 TaxID=2014261 RepID=A0A2M7G9B3_9BACT|nr:MAG: hypothetical protein COW64_04060 [bacterium (Candidatus Blackallbacteria) CG18_big_fil_WC_8_21_14_2_50_49_26]PIW18631.1 MAG: hypothetical protein COW36_04885 [bacterium (Candidatus Blackallbacteria) CG17_big_fil_post_rev_8_21_14_2_50_48_46]PIW46383.1 MAG: hypothetical protein COW20_15795 [bacterium (Candidatus Blackallbacteria) CG13_big_fil_rev_8_21_14_2_50_49_14]
MYRLKCHSHNLIIHWVCKFMGHSDSIFLSSLLGMLALSACQTKPPLLFSTQMLPASAIAMPLHENRQLSLNQIKGINYYPQAAPWEKFWLEYSESTVHRDLAKISNLGFNTVRIFVFYDIFGKDKPQAAMLNKLSNFLNQAESLNLKVVITLFDQYSDYAPEHYAQAQAHLIALSQNLGQHPAILAWDLKNESDLDYPHAGRETVKQWIQTMHQTLQNLVPQPITASYADSNQIGEEARELDYLTFHYYGREEAFSQTVKALQWRFPNQKLVLGEFGYHTWANNPRDPHPEAHQFNYYNSILAQAERAQLAGSMVWCLYDYPLNLKGTSVLQQESNNHHLGLLDLQGHEKSGLKAIQQRIRILDAETQGSVTPKTRTLELIYQQAPQESIRFAVQTPQSLNTLNIKSQTGLNQQKLSFSSQEIMQLLELKNTLTVNIQSAKTQAQTLSLILRQDPH